MGGFLGELTRVWAVDRAPLCLYRLERRRPPRPEVLTAPSRSYPGTLNLLGLNFLNILF